MNQVDGVCKGGGFKCYAWLQSHNKGPRGLYKADMAGIPAILWSGEQLKNSVNETTEDSFFPRVHEKRFDQLDKAPRNAGIFVCDRSDWAGGYWPEWCQERILEAARKRPDIRLYLLTKQPQELAKFSPFPDNCWVGVTACTQEMYFTAIHYLSVVEAKVKFLSIEPLTESIELFPDTVRGAGIKWVITGAQTKPVKYPEKEWVEEVVKGADEAGAKVFLKDNLKTLLLETGEDCRKHPPLWANGGWGTIRQEIPEG
jgi:hypothetical protein